MGDPLLPRVRSAYDPGVAASTRLSTAGALVITVLLAGCDSDQAGSTPSIASGSASDRVGSSPSVIPGSSAGPEDLRRLRILQHDAFLRCRVDGMQPRQASPGSWTDSDGGAYRDLSGYYRAAITRKLRLTGNDRQVNARLSECAAQAGWRTKKYYSEVGFRGRKRFEGRWNATLDVAVERHPEIDEVEGEMVYGKPRVMIQMETRRPWSP